MSGSWRVLSVSMNVFVVSFWLHYIGVGVSAPDSPHHLGGHDSAVCSGASSLGEPTSSGRMVPSRIWPLSSGVGLRRRRLESCGLAKMSAVERACEATGSGQRDSSSRMTLDGVRGALATASWFAWSRPWLAHLVAALRRSFRNFSDAIVCALPSRRSIVSCRCCCRTFCSTSSVSGRSDPMPAIRWCSGDVCR